jgi:hypothetical protein
VELEEVVVAAIRRHLRTGGGPASPFQAFDPSVGVDLAEDRLDHSRLRE